MNCTAIRDRLAALLYGDLEPVDVSAVQLHLESCPACRQEYTALQGVRKLLDAVPVPPTAVDLPALYGRMAEQQFRRLTRWRRAALAVGAVAALALLALGLQLQLRVENHQLTLRWGSSPPVIETAPPVPTAIRTEVRTVADDEQVQLLRELVYALQRDGDARDEQRRQELARLQARIAALQRQTEQRWVETEQNVAALYILSRKGTEP